MGEVKQIEIKNRTYYFYNDMINLKNLESNFAIKKIDDYESIYSVNPLYLRVNHVDGYIAEKNGNKYLILDSTDENKDILKNTKMFGMELKTKSKK